jgi:XTP/dITP diphosphohydrolase
MKKILIGTHNKGKFKEISFLLSKKNKKLSPFKLKLPSPKETGRTFLENSKLKARFFSKKTGMISISDDSGLAVSCLSNKPGIYSARWAKRYGGFKNAMKKIIELVNTKNKKKTFENRNAEFICSLTLKDPKGGFVSAIGKIKGKISKKILGNKGFGYDSIFVPKGKSITFGQMSKRKKILMDHRYLAFQKLKKKTNIL